MCLCLILIYRVDTEMNCHITGSLMPPHTGCMRWLSVHDAEYASEISSGKRKPRDHTKSEQKVQGRTTANREDSMVNSERPRKSRKRAVGE
uniref:Uncharacterized protein n=1 Tax=Aegilops tauschii subsp. strangulata TaxID=200361 RepID=A0A453KKF6_AEGTS